MAGPAADADHGGFHVRGPHLLVRSPVGKPMALTPTASSQVLTQSPQRIHFQFPSSSWKRAFSTPILAAIFRMTSESGHARQKELQNHLAGQQNLLGLGLHLQPLFHRVKAGSDQAGPVPPLDLHHAQAASPLGSQGLVVSRAWGSRSHCPGRLPKWSPPSPPDRPFRRS